MTNAPGYACSPLHRQVDRDLDGGPLATAGRLALIATLLGTSTTTLVPLGTVMLNPLSAGTETPLFAVVHPLPPTGVTVVPFSEMLVMTPIAVWVVELDQEISEKKRRPGERVEYAVPVPPQPPG